MSDTREVDWPKKGCTGNRGREAAHSRPFKGSGAAFPPRSKAPLSKIERTKATNLLLTEAVGVLLDPGHQVLLVGLLQLDPLGVGLHPGSGGLAGLGSVLSRLLPRPGQLGSELLEFRVPAPPAPLAVSLVKPSLSRQGLRAMEPRARPNRGQRDWRGRLSERIQEEGHGSSFGPDGGTHTSSRTFPVLCFLP